MIQSTEKFPYLTGDDNWMIQLLMIINTLLRRDKRQRWFIFRWEGAPTLDLDSPLFLRDLGKEEYEYVVWDTKNLPGEGEVNYTVKAKGLTNFKTGKSYIESTRERYGRDLLSFRNGREVDNFFREKLLSTYNEMYYGNLLRSGEGDVFEDPKGVMQSVIDTLWETNANDPFFKKWAGEVLGVTSSSIQIGRRGAAVPFHLEDNGLCSVNFCHFSDGEAGKIWIIIDPEVNNVEKFEEALHSFLEAIFTKDTIPFHCVKKHKTVFVTPGQLKKWGVKFSLVHQRPGDLVCVLAGVWHAVVSKGFSIHSSTNFISPYGFDLKVLEKFPKCGCPKKSRMGPYGCRHGQEIPFIREHLKKGVKSFLEENPAALMGRDDGMEIQRFDCICGLRSRSARALKEHQRVQKCKEPRKEDMSKFPCRWCGTRYSTKSNLNKHERKPHTGRLN